MPNYVDVAAGRSEPDPRHIDIKDLMNKVEKGFIQIPRFQREFVWKPKDSASLIDSILRNYPIGTVTMWNETTIRLETIELGGHKFPAPQQGFATNYVLDGQQRITSIYAVIKGITVKNQDYSKIYLLLEGTNSDDKLVVTDVDNLNPEQYISIKDLYDFDAAAILGRYGNPSISVIQAYSNRLKNYPIPTIEMTDASIEVATEIFTRINTQGKRLSLVEIMNAKVYDEARNFDLNEKRKNQKTSWATSNFDTISDATVMQALGLCIKAPYSAKGSAILSLTRDEVINNWDKIDQAFSRAIDYLRSSYRIPGSKFLPYDAMILPFVYYFYNHVSPVIEPTYEPYLRDYFWRCGLTQRYTEGLVGKVTQDVEMVRKLFQGIKPINHPAINISSQAIRQDGEYKSGSAYAKTFLCLYAAQGPKSFNTGATVILDNSWLSSSSGKNDHHFFPKAYMARVAPGRDVNNVVNITLIDSYLNKNIIRDRAPSDYMAEFMRLNPNLDSTMQTHLIGDFDEFGINANDYNLFFAKRVAEIQKVITSFIIPKAEDVVSG